MGCRIRILLMSVLLSFALLSCSERDNNFRVDLDGNLRKVIEAYVEEKGIAKNKKVIVTDWNVTVEGRIDILISNLNTDLYRDNTNAPTYYSELPNGIVVFIYTNVENALSRNSTEIVAEIDQVLLRNNIVLEPYKQLQYSAPTWRVTKCPDNGYRLTTELDPFEYQFVPCNYILRQDSVKSDSLYVIKAN